MPKDKIIAFIDFFYPPFRKIMPEQTFRYAACGGANTLLGLTIFYFCLKWIFKEQVVNVGFYVFEAYTVSLLISFCVNFIVGFLLMRYVVFVDSNLRGRAQLVRYLLSFIFNLFLNYFLLRLFVEKFNWDALLSQVLTTVIVVTFSYLSQKHFSFKVKPEDLML
jgi:putative flippase GtrA